MDLEMDRHGEVQFPFVVLPKCRRWIRSLLPEASSQYPSSSGKLACWKNKAWMAELLVSSGLDPQSCTWICSELRYSHACVRDASQPVGLLHVDGFRGEMVVLVPEHVRRERKARSAAGMDVEGSVDVAAVAMGASASSGSGSSLPAGAGDGPCAGRAGAPADIVGGDDSDAAATESDEEQADGVMEAPVMLDPAAEEEILDILRHGEDVDAADARGVPPPALPPDDLPDPRPRPNPIPEVPGLSYGLLNEVPPS